MDVTLYDQIPVWSMDNAAAAAPQVCPSCTSQLDHARRTVAEHAVDEDDARDLLAVMGLIESPHVPHTRKRRR